MSYQILIASNCSLRIAMCIVGEITDKKEIILNEIDNKLDIVSSHPALHLLSAHIFLVVY